MKENKFENEIETVIN